MLTDARSVPIGTVIETDVCIIGGGAAGITLAREFANGGLNVVLLESGGHEPDAATQHLYDGSNVGRPYEMFPRSRFRYFGGTTNGWGGAWCDLPSPLDFEAREGVPHTGWPFPLGELEPWYRRAQPVFRLGAYGYSLAEWGIKPDDIPAPFSGPHIITRVLQQGPLTRFGPHYGPELARAENVTVYLHANALRLERGEEGGPVEQVQVGVLPDGRFTVRSRIYILSSGGIENARLLLLSENEAGIGLGNERDLVGRYFMLHLEYAGGTIVPKDPHVDLSFQTGENGAKHRRESGMGRFVSYVSLSDETKQAQNLPATRWRFQYPRLAEMEVLRRIVFRTGTKAALLRDMLTVIRKSPGLAAFVIRRVIHGRNKPPSPLAEIPVNCTTEQMPNPESRITLGTELDAFGLRKVALDWQLTEQEQRGIAMSAKLLGEELERGGFGTLRTNVPDIGGGWPVDMFGDQHHMGTTRMHRDPAQGVVDENCRVHGVDNVYVAGCSVFTTGGTFNPTLTIIALALRLADHVKERLR